MHENLCVVLNNDSCFDHYKAQLVSQFGWTAAAVSTPLSQQ